MSDFQKRVIAVYKKKGYELNLDSFKRFLKQKINVDSFQIQLIQKKLKEFNIEDEFDELTLRILLRIITAVQTKSAEVKQMNLKQIQQINATIIWKEKKPTKQQKISANQKSEQRISSQKSSKEIIQVEDQEKPQKKQLQKEQKCIDYVLPNQFKQKKSSKESRKLSTIEQVDNSTEINLNHTGPQVLDMSESRDLSEKVEITHYEKLSSDYGNPVIKYSIKYKDSKQAVKRRFSDFEKLINILRQRYEGFILPRLPPKEGMKAGINYFWGIDVDFLQERKKKLEQMLNRLLQNKFLYEDKILYKFLTDQKYQIECNNKQSYGSYLKSLTDIVFNAKQLKDFGVAYYNYFREKGNVKLDAEIQRKYSKVTQFIEVFTALNTYRKRININFDKRRQLIHNLQINSKIPPKSSFDRLMDQVEEEIQDLNFEFENYKDLKSQQSWILELIRQKQGDSQKIIHDLREQQNTLIERLKKIEKNFKLSLDEFYSSKTQKLKEISEKILGWRAQVHP